MQGLLRDEDGCVDLLTVLGDDIDRSRPGDSVVRGRSDDNVPFRRSSTPGIADGQPALGFRIDFQVIGEVHRIRDRHRPASRSYLELESVGERHLLFIEADQVGVHDSRILEDQYVHETIRVRPGTGDADDAGLLVRGNHFGRVIAV